MVKFEPVKARSGLKDMEIKEKIDWTLYDHLLGTMDDQDLAGIAGCTHQNVSLRRRQQKIMSFRKVVKKIREEVDRAALCARAGEKYIQKHVFDPLLHPLFNNIMNDPREVALRKGIAMLGTGPDSEIAEILEVDERWLGRRRLELGIRKYSVEEMVLERARDMLGVISDRKIAKWLKVSPNAVTKARNKAEIPSAWPSAKKDL